jgi:triacylglycerol lipase
MSIPRLRAPVVFVHGLFGFDQLRLGRWRLASYFRDIPDALRAAGNRVLVARVSPTGGIADRAAQLKDFLDRRSPHEPVHLFGHSMGGLDARYLITHLGMAHRVLSLTTLGTPHRGSSFADWGIRRLQRVLRPILEWAGIPYQGFHDLTTTGCAQLNRRTPDAPGVRYFSVAGRFSPSWFSPEWQLPARIVARLEGDNDGVVSMSSARYGESCEVWEGDHLNLIDWRRPGPGRLPIRSRIDDYARLVGRLADEGF